MTSRMSKVKKENLGQVTKVLTASHNFGFYSVNGSNFAF